WERQMDYFSRMVVLVEDQIDQLREVPTNRGWAAMQMHGGKEQLRPFEFNSVRNANVAHEPARTCGTDCLHHRLLRANALKHGICADSLRQVFNARDALVTTFSYDVGC